MPTADPKDERALLDWKPPSILLIDGDVSRRDERATSMRRLGLAVDCADGAVGARALWQPEKYQLVLVELCGAAPETSAFCIYLQEHAPLQKMGIYRAKHPFIVSARKMSFVAVVARLTSDNQRRSATLVTDQRGQTGLSRAAQQIAALRPRTARYVAAPYVASREAPGPAPALETAADIAARVLGNK